MLSFSYPTVSGTWKRCGVKGFFHARALVCSRAEPNARTRRSVADLPLLPACSCIRMSAPDPGTLLNRLVDTHWETAARHAWRQYNQRGRGAIVFTVQPSADTNERTPLKYLTFNDESAAEGGAFSTLHDLIRTYDPEQEVVTAAVLPDERTVFEVYDQDPPPPDA